MLRFDWNREQQEEGGDGWGDRYPTTWPRRRGPTFRKSQIGELKDDEKCYI